MTVKLQSTRLGLKAGLLVLALIAWSPPSCRAWTSTSSPRTWHRKSTLDPLFSTNDDSPGRIDASPLQSGLGPKSTGALRQPKQQLKKKTLQTFSRYLEVECWKRQEIRDLEPVLRAVADGKCSYCYCTEREYVC
jgi:hypothetical protein